MMDLSEYRQNYLKGGLVRKDLNVCPIEQFDTWFEQAREAEYLEPNAMSLATATKEATPSLRTVLLKYFDASGFVFFTNYTSQKAKELEENPQASLLFPWVSLERQIIISGSVEKISTKDSLKYFLKRPHESQLGAWVSDQSSVISNKSILKQKLAEMSKKLVKGQVPLPDFWGGYRVVPHSIEFWQGGAGRIHDRFRYVLEKDGQWNVKRLAP